MAGRINDAVGLAYYPVADYSAKKGCFVTLGVSDGVMKCTLATAGANPDGYLEVGTTTAKPSTVYACIEGQRVMSPLLATNAAIAIGDELVTTAAGTVDKLPTAVGTYVVVGKAETAHDALAGADGEEVVIRLKRRVVVVTE